MQDNNNYACKHYCTRTTRATLIKSFWMDSLTEQKHTYLNDQHTGQQQEKAPQHNRTITEMSVIMYANEQADSIVKLQFYSSSIM